MRHAAGFNRPPPATAAAKAPGHVLVQDTAWPGYEEIPGWIVDGYDTLFTEIDQISETADDDRTQEILGALYDYAEHIAPER